MSRALLSSIMNAASGLVDTGAQIWGTLYQNRANRAESAANRSFQAEMSNTSHQREVEDLRAAGLNPLLSATGGASTPSGAVAHIESPTRGVSMLDKIAAAYTIEQNQANISKTEAETEVALATKKNLIDQGNLIVANTIKALSEALGVSSDQLAWDFGFFKGHSQSKRPRTPSVKFKSDGSIDLQSMFKDIDDPFIH